MAEKGTVSTQILDTAQWLIQTRGYNGFSYADISVEVGLRKASIHHYFPSKAALCLALVTRYRDDIHRKRAFLDLVAEGADQKLIGYAHLCRDILRDGNRMCLCGALALDLATLPSAVQMQVQGFFAENELWLSTILEEGRTQGRFDFHGSSETQAQAFLSGLEGAMLLARAHQDVTRYCASAHQHLSLLGLGAAIDPTSLIEKEPSSMAGTAGK